MLVIEVIINVVVVAAGSVVGLLPLATLPEGHHRGRPGRGGIVPAQVVGSGCVVVAVEGDGGGQVLEAVKLVDGLDIGRHPVVLAGSEAREQGVGDFVVRGDRAAAGCIGPEHVEPEGLLVIVHAIDGGGTVVGVDGTGGVRHGGVGDGTAVFGGVLVGLPEADIQQQVLVQQDGIELEGGGEHVLLVALDSALAVLEAQGNAIGEMREGSLEGHGVPVVEGCLGDGFLPVAVGVTQQGGVPSAADVFLPEFIGPIDL